MGRPPRINAGNKLYHAMNRGNGRLTIFGNDDFLAFERVLEAASEKYPEVQIRGQHGVRPLAFLGGSMG